MVNRKISVIIVNYNAGTELLRCVQSLGGSEGEIEIIVVDNDSEDNSLDVLKKNCGDGEAIIIENKENLGFAVACNQGALSSTGDFLLYLNPDCTIKEKTIPILIENLIRDKKAGMVGGLILNPDGTEQRGCRRDIPTPWKSLVNSFGLRSLAKINQKFFADFRLDREPLPEAAISVEAISGACMMVTREAYEKVGPMDEEYFLHCEDLDWCMQFRNKGYDILFVPQAVLIHRQGTCSRSRPVFVEWNKHKGMQRFYKKHFARQYSLPMMWLVITGIWFRFGLSLIKCFFDRLTGMRRRCV